MIERMRTSGSTEPPPQPPERNPCPGQMTLLETLDVQITNGRTTIAFETSGAIARVMNAESGHVYFDAHGSDQRLFHLVVPSTTWSSRFIAAHEQAAPLIAETRQGCTLRYADLELGGRPSGISAEVSFETPPGTDEIRMSLRLTNEGNETVNTAIFPWVNGWQNPADSDQILLGPAFKKPLAELSHWCPAWGNDTLRHELTADYPTFASVPWADVSGKDGGVSFVNYQRQARQFFVAAKNMPGHAPKQCAGLLWGFYAYVPPGCQWESPFIGISVHDGDWHQTADRYRQWATTWLAPAPSRALRESIGSEHVFFTSFDGTPFHPYEDMPKIAATGRKHGVRELCVWDQHSLGIYCSQYPADANLLKYGAADHRAIRQAIQQSVEGGSDVSALVNLVLLNTTLDIYDKEGLESEVQRAYDGSAKVEVWSARYIPGRWRTPHLGPYCQFSSPFSERERRRLLDIIHQYLDLGYTSLFYDMPFETHPDYSRKDDGCIPEMTYAARLAFIGEVRDKLRGRNPNAAIMGEQCDVFGSQVIDQWMAWSWSDLDIATAIRLHYSLPQTVINCVIDSDTNLASHAFAAGLHLFLMTQSGTGTLSDVPEFADHVKKLSALWERCADRTVHARFCDQMGLSVQTSDELVAYSYESDAGPAVIAAAPKRTGQIVVDLDRQQFANPGAERGRIIHLDGREAEAAGNHQKFGLREGEVLVWLA